MKKKEEKKEIVKYDKKMELGRRLTVYDRMKINNIMSY